MVYFNDFFFFLHYLGLKNLLSYLLRVVVYIAKSYMWNVFSNRGSMTANNRPNNNHNSTALMLNTTLSSSYSNIALFITLLLYIS